MYASIAIPITETAITSRMRSMRSFTAASPRCVSGDACPRAPHRNARSGRCRGSHSSRSANSASALSC